MVVKLRYFNMTGLGEPIRLMLAATKTEFEDIRLNKEEWAKMKPTLKWPFLPVLEMDGKSMVQSVSICRYIAKKNSLCGSSEDDAYACDATVDHLEDIRKKIVVHYYTPDSKERDEGLEKNIKVDVPFYMKNFEEQLAENNGYLVGGKLTWADIMFLSYSDYLSFILGHDIVTGFPKLKEHKDKISDLPGIKEWLATRPTSVKDLRTLFM